MSSYRLYFMNQRHAISSAEYHDCTGDDEARQRAMELLTERPHQDAIEVWELTRFVARHDRH
jgi:hypothetical protein